jgi:hypothetical protein
LEWLVRGVELQDLSASLGIQCQQPRNDYAVLDKLPANYTYPVFRMSATSDGDILYFGTQTHALLVALNRTSGTALANLQINAHQSAVLTTSQTVYNHTIFIGGSSQEENAASDIPSHKCCSFAGNMIAASFSQPPNTFTTLWNVSMLPLGAVGPAGLRRDRI